MPLAIFASVLLSVSMFAPAQSEPDMFSCIEPSRLADGALTYEYPPLAEGIGPTHGTLTIARVRDANEDFVRMIWQPIPGIEMVTDLNPGSLAPVSFRVSSRSSGEIMRIAMVDDQIRTTQKGAERAVQAGGSPIVFGIPDLLELLSAAVNWDRCPSVRVRYLVGADKIEVAALRRTGTTTIPYQGATQAAHTIAIDRIQGRGTVVVTTRAPYISMQYIRPAGSVYRVISKQPV